MLRAIASCPACNLSSEACLECQLSFHSWTCAACYVRCCAELSHVIAPHGLRFHQYADDCQINICSPVSAVHSMVEQFSCCPHDVEVRMSASRLHLNPSETVVLWFCS